MSFNTLGTIKTSPSPTTVSCATDCELDSSDDEKITSIALHAIEQIKTLVPPAETLLRYKVFLATNECITPNPRAPNILAGLARVALEGDTVVGTASFYLLNLAYFRGSATVPTQRIEKIIMVDNSLNAKLLWENIQTILLESDTKEKFLEELETHLTENALSYYPDTRRLKDAQSRAQIEINKIKREIKKQCSWLQTTDSFRFIKSIFERGNFAFLANDLAVEKEMKALSTAFKHTSLKVDSYYLSNVHELCFFEDCLEDYHRSLHSLLEDRQIVIRTAHRLSVRQWTPLVQEALRIRRDKIAQIFPAVGPR